MSNRGDLVAGRYRLLERIATGGMGVVWRGWDERLRRVVAVKELLVHPGLGDVATEQAARRAMREARLTARLQHPHAIPVYDVVEHDGRPCLIMEYLPSHSLQSLLTDRQQLSVEEVAAVGSQIAGALSAAHSAGIVHRDVKPANVLLADDGTAKLTDFGISRAFDDVTLTSSGMVTGTPAYLAPEVARGQSADFPSDVFSLGSTLYAALEGHPPFGAHDNPIALLHRVASGQLIAPRRCGRLTPLIIDMLQADPARRPTMRQVEQALAVAAAGGSAPVASHLPVNSSAQTQQLTLSSVPPSPPPSPSPSPSPSPRSAPAASLSATRVTAKPRRKRGLLIAATLAATLAIGGAVAAVIANSNGAKTVAGSTSATSRQAARSSTSASPPVKPLQPPAPSARPAPSSTATTPATQPTSPTTSTRAPGSVPSTPQAVVSSYYTLVPDDLATAWSRLTVSYQQSHANGFSDYQQFWNSVARVTTTNVTAHPDGSVDATVTYTYKDGRVVAEQTTFGLAQDGTELKINSTSVLSSRTQ